MNLQVEYNKVCKELDEVKGDLIESSNEVRRLKLENTSLLRRCRPEEPHNNYALPWAILFGIALVITWPLAMWRITTLKQELLWWKCEPSYQTPTSPTPLEN